MGNKIYMRLVRLEIDNPRNRLSLFEQIPIVF